MAKQSDFQQAFSKVEKLYEALVNSANRQGKPYRFLLIAYDVNTQYRDMRIDEAASRAGLKLVIENVIKSINYKLKDVYESERLYAATLREAMKEREDFCRDLLLAFIRLNPKRAKLSESSYAIRTKVAPDDIFQLFIKYIDQDTDRFTVITLAKPFESTDPRNHIMKCFSLLN